LCCQSWGKKSGKIGLIRGKPAAGGGRVYYGTYDKRIKRPCIGTCSTETPE